MSEDEKLNPVEETAFPFLQHAVQLDQARSAWAVLDKALGKNAEMWLKLSDDSIAAHGQLPLETIEFIHKTSAFVAKVAAAVRTEMDDKLLDTLIKLNLNMSEMILSKDDKAA
jgi:hypothetical protein